MRIQGAVRILRGWWALVAVMAGATAAAQDYSTAPLYNNPTRPVGTQAVAAVTLSSGAIYPANARPRENSYGRFKLDAWTMGMPIPLARPDYSFGDVIAPPPLADLTQVPTVVTTNGAFYMSARKQLIAAQAGSCTVSWPMADGSGSKVVTYNIGSFPTKAASRLFWTDNYTVGGVSSNSTALPDNTELSVSFHQVYAKIHYNITVPDFDLVNSQDSDAGRTARSANAVTHQDMAAVWIDTNNQLRARYQRGYFIVEYFDTPTFDNSVGYEIVSVGPARVYQSPVTLGERLLPSEGAEVAAGLEASLSKAKDYVVKWTASGSHFSDYIFATAVNSDITQPAGDPSKTQVLWQRTGNLGIVWPYELHWYSITWPGDRASRQFVFDPANVGASPAITVPTNYTASVVWAEKADAILKSDSSTSKVSPVGEGRALLQYQNSRDVWFVPIRVVARTNGAYVSNEEMYWPIGKPLTPVVSTPRLQFDGTQNSIGFSTDLQPAMTAELWVKPAVTNGTQSLMVLLDYPQQASPQVALYLDGGIVRLSVLPGRNPLVSTSSSTPLSPGVWSHVAFTKQSSGEMALYVNGQSAGTLTATTFNGQPATSTTYAQVTVGQGFPVSGAVGTALSYFNGEVREVRVWSTGATASQINQNMNVQLSGGEFGLSHLITSAWQETGTPYSGATTERFEVLDKVTGGFVAGYGSPSTSGQSPFLLDQRLGFGGGGNWADVPVSWNRLDPKTAEFWLYVGNSSQAQVLLSLANASVTNFALGLSGGRLTLSAPGQATATGGSSLLLHGSYHVAIVSSNGVMMAYLDGVQQSSLTLPGTGSSVVGNRLLVGAPGFPSGYSGLTGEVHDLRLYGGARDASTIASDRISVLDTTDPTLLRAYDFDRVLSATVNGEAVLQLPDSALGYAAVFHGPSVLGSNLYRQPGTETGGLLRAGTAYHPAVYQSEGRIIPVNALPSAPTIEVWWPAEFTAEFLDQPLSIPGIVSRYRLMNPLSVPQLVVAGQDQQGYAIPSGWENPSVYYQNDPTAAGYNPNDEHALILGTSAYATRWDLNTTNTSPGYVLLQYQDPAKNLASYIQPVQVIATNAVYPNFDRTLLVAQLLQPPTPLIDLVPYSSLSGPTSDPNNRLYKDRRNNLWARSAVSSGTPDSIGSRWYYPLKPGFYWPSSLGTKVAGDPVPFGNTNTGLVINYTLRWPDVVPTLALGETLVDATASASGDGNLPAIRGNLSVEILYDEATSQGKSSARLLDPSNPSTTTSLQNLNGISTATDIQLGLTYFTLLPPHLRNRVTWDPISKALTLSGQIVDSDPYAYVLPAWLGSTTDPNSDYSFLAGLSTAPSWQTAVNALRRSANVITNAETPMDSVVLTPTGTAGGYMTIGFNTRSNLNNTGEIVSLAPIRVDATKLFTGRVIVMYSANKFDQYTTLRHSGDFGGDTSQYQFEWSYAFPDNGQVPAGPDSAPSQWVEYLPPTSGLNRIVFGGPGLMTLKDVYFSCRWRCISSTSVNTNWSQWTSPAMVQSWLTRALDGINPFEQRLESLANNHVDLTSSILTQAGKRFVGAVPLNMENVDNYGLIEIYETLLAQARNLSIDAGYSDNDVNASLLDAASKLNELYTMLGDEALSDAKDPTIAWGSRDLNDVYFGSRASSLFAFQGIVPNLLEEELALLRGLDDSTSTPVTTYPVYNRLYWNFTKGINSGEPAYALNYAIPSVTGDALGSITEADAERLYPQGHGDAYGHYLTALMEYYRLLANTNFTWIPRAEVKTIGEVNVTFDYVDERKMAASAVQLGRTAVEIMDRTFRRDYSQNAADKLRLYSDSNTNRAWSVSEWAGRSSQGALFNWITLNSMLPLATPNDTPQNISRSTVPELAQLAGLVESIQDKQDDVDRGDSPMGVASNVVPFDLDPTLVDKGIGHFDQIYGRAVSAMQTAYALLERASEAASNLRRQDVSLESFRYQVAQRESEFNQQLIDLYGTPYPDDIGPTGAYSTGYDGPDLYHFNYIDRDLFNPADAGAVTNVTFFAQYSVTGDNLDTLSTVGTNVTYSINGDLMPVLPDAWSGQRAAYGKIQSAMGDYVRSWIGLRAAAARQEDNRNQLEARLQRLRDHNTYSDYYGAIADRLSNEQMIVNLAKEGLETVLATLDTLDAEVQSAADALEKPLPASFIAGLADGGDLSFPARVGFEITRAIGEESIGAAKDAANLAVYAAGKASDQLDSQLSDNADALATAEDQSQTAMETAILLSRVNSDRDSVYGAAVAVRQALQNYVSLVSQGRRLQADLLAFRQANASRIQEARYADVIFRTFKNEDLEEYLGAFQRAARYVYAAARVYDYETGLLDPTVVAGQDGDFMGDTMRATQLGDMVDGQPVPGSVNSRSLASTLARMRANWEALRGRFGINNPSWENHRISLRRELFRIGSSTNPIVEATNLSAWQNKLYTYRVADIRQVPEFKAFCQAYSPMSTNEPAIVIPFSTEIRAGRNLFGLPLAGGDSVFDSAHFTTKLRGVTLTFAGYNGSLASTLTRTPRAYLVPAGIDRQRTPISGGAAIRDWRVVDQVWPIPYPSAAGNVSLPLESIGTDNVHSIRRFSPMRVFDDQDVTATTTIPYDSRLIARSIWNTEWVLIIPGSTLSSSPSTALDSLIGGISDIYLMLQTYSYSGN